MSPLTQALTLAQSTARRGELVFWWTFGGPAPEVLEAWRALPLEARARWSVIAPPSLDGCLRPLLACALASDAEGGRAGALVIEWSAPGADPPRERALTAALPQVARVCVQARVDLRVVAQRRGDSTP